MNTNRDVIIACDFKTGAETLDFLGQFGESRPFAKIGMELFYAEGPEIVRAIKGRGHRIFLDLKLHDIPNTVKKAMASLAPLGVDIINVHAAGGSEMMRAAVEGATRPDGTRSLLIAVTQLTSTSERMLHDELLISGSMEETAVSYAQNAARCGLDGVICSPLESAPIHAACGEGFLAITPGIRFAGGDTQDQFRVTTPADAKKLGSDLIVVGRPITQASSPKEAYEQAMANFAR